MTATSGDLVRLISMIALRCVTTLVPANRLGVVAETCLGAVLAPIVHWLTGWLWVTCFLTTMGGVFIASTMIGQIKIILSYNLLSRLHLFPLLLGSSVALISRYFFNSGWGLAVADGLGFMMLVPAAVLAVMNRLGLIWFPSTPTDLKAFMEQPIADTVIPLLEDAIKRRQRALKYLDECGVFTADKCLTAMRLFGREDQEGDLDIQEMFRLANEAGRERHRSQLREGIMKGLNKYSAMLAERQKSR